MTYFGFLGIFLVPPIVLLLVLLRGRLGRSQVAALALVVVLALAYTTPWDNYLVIRGVWTFDRARIAERFIWRVPLEEYLFYVLQVLMSGLFTLWLLTRRSRPGTADAVSPGERDHGG
jgi:lycopene cyclase domain-containing protein